MNKELKAQSSSRFAASARRSPIRTKRITEAKKKGHEGRGYGAGRSIRFVLRPCSLTVAVICAIIGIIALTLSTLQYLSKYQSLKRELRLIPAAGVYRLLMQHPIRTYQKVYFFNVTNLEMLGKGTLPNLKELEPYNFNVETTRELEGQGGRRFLKFSQKKRYYASPDEELRARTETITTGSLYSQYKGYFQNRSLGATPLFVQRKAYELMFAGYEESVDDEDSELKVVFPRFGFFVWQNTSKADETYEVYSGFLEEDRERINEIVSYMDQRELPFFPPECNGIFGTNGELFRFFMRYGVPKRVTIFLPQLCKPWDLHFQKVFWIRGLRVVRYGAGEDFLNGPGLEPGCEYHENEFKGTYDGTYGHFYAWNSSDGTFGSFSPILSLPHFFNADPRLPAQVIGMEPNREKHDFYIDVCQELGIVLDAHIRLQYNHRLKKGALQPGINDIILPIYWLEIFLNAQKVLPRSRMCLEVFPLKVSYKPQEAVMYRASMSARSYIMFLGPISRLDFVLVIDSPQRIHTYDEHDRDALAEALWWRVELPATIIPILGSTFASLLFGGGIILVGSMLTDSSWRLSSHPQMVTGLNGTRKLVHNFESMESEESVTDASGTEVSG